MKIRIRKIADHFGVDSQISKTQEELAELIQAISKVRIEGFDRKGIDMVKEIADVEIMLDQLKHLYNIPEHYLKHCKFEKINRTIERHGVKI